jgi:hypothetical protein
MEQSDMRARRGHFKRLLALAARQREPHSASVRGRLA